MIRFLDEKSDSIFDRDLHYQTAHAPLILDESIWRKCREYFFHHRSMDLVPVLDKERGSVCFAYQDREADREIRMLKELGGGIGMISFRDLYPDRPGVVIHGCNELAWYLAKYLIKEGIAVHVDGGPWKALGIKEDQKIQQGRIYEIWAEGVHQRGNDLSQVWARSASAEFECVDEIYEANIKAGKITDADGDVDALLSRLCRERQIVIRGVGTKAQDAYDWLLSKGIDICAFQSGRERRRKSLFGKPIMREEEVRERFREAVIIECSEKYSAWGSGDVDQYDHEGYERNKRYILLRDYIDVPGSDLVHILAEKNLFLVGDIWACSRVHDYLQSVVSRPEDIRYLDVGGYRGASEKVRMCVTDGREATEDSIYLLVSPGYSACCDITAETAQRSEAYRRSLDAMGIYDHTDYFSDIEKYIHLEKEAKPVRSSLHVAGILLGVIPPHCGNVLVRQSLAGHPQVLMIEEYGYFNSDLYLICIRLAERPSHEVLDSFRRIYREEAAHADIPEGFDKEKFYQKMAGLLEKGEQFTSQELFIIFHIAYGAGFGKEYMDVSDIVIYWEPHMWNRRTVKEWGHWFGAAGIKCFILKMVRNRYIHAGSAIRYQGLVWKKVYRRVCGPICMWEERRDIKGCEERVVRFEDLKCRPQEILTGLCEWLGIAFDPVLLDTTYHGEKAFYDGTITGFDVKPAYDLHEEYFSAFDRMRISLIQSLYQRKYGYPYVSCTEFSRRELQEMFLKRFRWEKIQGVGGTKTVLDVQNIYRLIARQLWMMRFAEKMEMWQDEDLELI